MLLCAFVAGLLLMSYENFMTSAIIVAPESPSQPTINSLFQAGYTLLHKSHIKLPKPVLSHYAKHAKPVNSSNFKTLKAMDANKEYLAYFQISSDTEGRFFVDDMQLVNKGCNCFILRLGEIPGYTAINHSLRSRFLRTLNRLQQNGIYHFYKTRCPISAQMMQHTKSERRLEAEELERTSKIRGSPSSEFESTIYIGSSNLNVIFCLLGILFIFFTLLFILVELKLFIKSVRCLKLFFSKRIIKKFYYRVRSDVIALVRDLNP
jgi:hypothetical protein